MPLTWKQVEKGVKISDFTIKNASGLLKKNGSAWENLFEKRQELNFKS
jgi:DNA primase